MTAEGLKELFCEWCPKECENLQGNPLTDEERAGCVAAIGFETAALDAAIEQAKRVAMTGTDAPDDLETWRICLEAWLRELWAGRDPRETLPWLMC